MKEENKNTDCILTFGGKCIHREKVSERVYGMPGDKIHPGSIYFMMRYTRLIKFLSFISNSSPCC